ncbi:MAG: hypothetical protein HW412_1439 [Bacteroidetes bacterium]|nr:hypothetical protein [Bacteroidota bacterium]
MDSLRRFARQRQYAASSTYLDTNVVREQPANEVSSEYAGWQSENHLVRDSTDIRPGVSTKANDGPHEMTREIYDMLNSLPPPKPTGHFTMDGELDTSAVLLASNGAINLYGAVRGSQLYVATNSAQSQRADMFIFVAVVPGSLRNAPWLKTGQVAAWSAFLENASTRNSRSWYDASSSVLTSITVDTAGGAVLEGVIDVELLTGTSPGTVYLAVGKYQTRDGGTLLGQVPHGNGDGTIDPDEFYELGTGLPFNLGSFSATLFSGRHVRLNWTTLRETDNHRFEIQRRRSRDAEFRTLRNSFVPGHGTTIEPQSYSYTDTTATIGSWRYRLRQIDLNGTVHYGPEEMVNVRKGIK